MNCENDAIGTVVGLITRTRETSLASKRIANLPREEAREFASILERFEISLRPAPSRQNTLKLNASFAIDQKSRSRRRIDQCSEKPRLILSEPTPSGLHCRGVGGVVEFSREKGAKGGLPEERKLVILYVKININ